MTSPYLAGLVLQGRRVVVVGGGQVAQRRVPALIDAGADVLLVAPEVSPALQAIADAGEITWHDRTFVEEDLDDAWYVVAATDDAEVNAAVGAAAEARRVFCVRSDDAYAGTAWTPATGRHDSLTVGVLGAREPRRTARTRDALVAALRDGLVSAREDGVRRPGVVLVGGGPGDPDLVNVAARRALADADVVIADRLAPRSLLGDLPDGVEVVDVAKLPRGRHTPQEAINARCVAEALAGKQVVRFKGGDTFVFGRGFEEVLACEAAGVAWSVVPGLSSSYAVPATAGIPVTHRGVAHEFTVVSGHLAPGHPGSLVDWSALGALRGTVVCLMAVANAGAIADALVAGGRDPRTPVAVIAEGTMPGERRVLTRLESLAADIARIEPPAVIVVGDVVAVGHPDAYPDRLTDLDPATGDRG
ncbi:uroporphyrinogen-III C-methyltransferase [Nocardioidaceae bacterium]|nr:uroporphyrinogen-III C-methyltransferase [Nocardioidaceae bacterium]